MDLNNFDYKIINDGGYSSTPKIPEPTLSEPTHPVDEPLFSVGENVIDADGDNNPELIQELAECGGKTFTQKEIHDSDDNGVVEKKVEYDKDGKIKSERIYNNLTGKEKTHIEYLEDGSVNYRVDSKYNLFGKIKKEVQRDGDGKILNTTKYKYNLNGTTDVVKKSHDGKHDWTHHYDKNGKETERTFTTINSDGNKVVTTWDFVNDTETTQIFDSEGNLIE